MNKQYTQPPPNTCKGKAPVSVKEKCVFVPASKREHGYRCVHVINQISDRQLLVWGCNGSALGSAKSEPRDVRIFVHVRSRVGLGVCICHLNSPVDSYLCVYVCRHVNTTKRLQLHRAFILLLIIQQFVLKMLSYSHTTTPCNLINKQSANSSTQRKSPTGHTH